MTITQKPAALNMSGNLPDILVTNATGKVPFKLFKETDLLVEESYQADSEGSIRIRIKEVIHESLSLHIPVFNTDLYFQDNGHSNFKVLIGSSEVIFKVIKGGVDIAVLDSDNFLSSNFLTWQPQQKLVKYHDPEWLTYYAKQEIEVKITAYFSDRSFETITYLLLSADSLSSINVNYGHIKGRFQDQPVYFDVWTESVNTRKSYIQRYVLNSFEVEFDDLFIFENTVGGIDTIRFSGQSILVENYNTETALIDDVTHEYFSESDKSIEKNSGFFKSERERIWALEFFASIQRYHVFDGVVKRILVNRPILESIEGQLNNYKFYFQPSFQTKYLNIARSETIPENLEIIGPDDEVFFLVPRLNEYASVFDIQNVIFPVQLPYEGKWKKLTFKQLEEYLTGVVMEHLPIEDFLPEFITLTGDQTFVYSNDINKTVDKETITLSASEHNFNGEPGDRLWEYHNGVMWVPVPNTFNTLTFDLRHDAAIWNGNDSLSIRYRVGELLDQMTIVKLYSGESALTVVVSSTYGDRFFNGNIDTTLTASVYWGGENITDTIPESGFNWMRISNNPAEDEIWNFHEGKARKSVDIDHTDVFRKAVFSCEVEVNI